MSPDGCKKQVKFPEETGEWRDAGHRQEENHEGDGQARHGFPVAVEVTDLSLPAKPVRQNGDYCKCPEAAHRINEDVKQDRYISIVAERQHADHEIAGIGDGAVGEQSL